MNRSTLLCWWVVCLLVAGCGRKHVEHPSASGPVHATDLYPMTLGSAWSYDVLGDDGDGDSTLAVSRVEERSGPLVSIRTGTGPFVRYEIRDEGIIRLKDGVWLLRDPIAVGESWRGREGRIVTIASVDKKEVTRAGTFERCVEVLEKGGETGVDVATTYCPQVGPVRVKSSVRSAVREKVTSVEAQLRGFQIAPTNNSSRE